jgi:indoleamine 2,3-dioxygenase
LMRSNLQNIYFYALFIHRLYNWKRVNPAGPVSFDNMELVRSFSGEQSETGFILVHVAMVAHTNHLVKNCLDILEHTRNKDRQAFNAALQGYQQAMRRINREMDSMWLKSKPEDYEKFRSKCGVTFLMNYW